MSDTTKTSGTQQPKSDKGFIAGGMVDLYSGFDTEYGKTEVEAEEAFKKTYGRNPDYVRPA